MSTLALLISMTNNDTSNSSKMFNGVLSLTYVLGTALALYLAIRDGGQQTRTLTKVWVFLLALLEPGFFIILHGISASLTGSAFFAPTPLVGSSPLNLTPPSLSATSEAFSKSLTSTNS